MKQIIALAATALLATNVMAADLKSEATQHDGHHTDATQAAAHDKKHEAENMAAHKHDHQNNAEQASKHAKEHNDSHEQAHLHDHNNQNNSAHAHADDHAS